MLAGFLETFPYRSLLHGVYIADGVEFILQLAVAREGAVYIVGVFGESVDFVDDGVLALEICGLGGFLSGNPFAFLGAQTLYHELELTLFLSLRLLTFSRLSGFMEHAVELTETANLVGGDF